jgi:hypothetical protein
MGAGDWACAAIENDAAAMKAARHILKGVNFQWLN